MHVSREQTHVCDEGHKAVAGSYLKRILSPATAENFCLNLKISLPFPPFSLSVFGFQSLPSQDGHTGERKGAQDCGRC